MLTVFVLAGENSRQGNLEKRRQYTTREEKPSPESNMKDEISPDYIQCLHVYEFV